VSLPDVLAMPFFERYVASVYYWKAMDVRGDPRYKAIDEWMAAMERELPAYAAMKADFFSTVHDIPPQYGTAFSVPAAAQCQALVDGHGDHWDWPLATCSPLGVEPATGPRELEPTPATLAARREAARRLARNHERILKFALRGSPAVAPVARTAAAPLSNPGAPSDPSPATRAAVDLGLRGVFLALGGDGNGPGGKEALTGLAKAAEAESLGAEDRAAAVSCLAYFRDRVGVPRDMGAAAAREMRAAVNETCRALVGVAEWEAMRGALVVKRA